MNFLIRLATAFLAVMMLSAGLTSCSPASAQAMPGPGKIGVFTTILPASYFSQRVGGDRVSVQVLIEPGADVHTFDPAPQQMAALAKSAIYFPLGVQFEHNTLQKIRSNFPSLKVVPMQTGISLIKSSPHHHGSDNEGLEEHSEGEGDWDPHVWISPRQVSLLAANIKAALIEISPADKDLFEKNYVSFKLELDQLDAKLIETFAPIKGQTFFVYHPSLGYLAADYGLHQEAVEVEGKSPSAQNLKSIIDEARADGVRVIFVQAEFDPSVAKTVAEAIGGVVVPFNDLAYNYFDNLNALAVEISDALKGKVSH